MKHQLISTPRRIVSFLALIWLAATAACAPMDARSRADRDIQRYRTRDLAITVKDSAGHSIPNATVTLEQTRKAFPFGSSISAAFLRNPQWQQSFKSHFNTAVFENESKWYTNEPAPGRTNYRDADALLAWCNTNNIPVRGHCLFWEAQPGPPKWLSDLTQDQLQAAVESRAASALAHFQSKFIAWDVNNEMLHGTFFIDKLGPGIRPWMYQRAHELDAHAQLFVNDYNILSIDQNYKDVQTDAYIAQIRDLLAQGAPITGIGIQGHIWKEDILNHPEVIRQRLDKIATLNLPIWITEFDYDNPDDHLRADVLDLVYRTAYSHPSVQGIMMWVYWAGNSWRGPNAALFNRDWTINEEGRRFEALMKEWTTSAELHTDLFGHAHTRGFFGDYALLVTAPGHTMANQTFHLSPAAVPESLTIILSP